MSDFPTFVITRGAGPTRACSAGLRKAHLTIEIAAKASGYPGWLGCALAHAKLLGSVPNLRFWCFKTAPSFRLMLPSFRKFLWMQISVLREEEQVLVP
jgi:hypothetical protein